MTINVTDIKLLRSERMTDTTDGGGRRTSNVIPDGVPGNIFPKVSRLDAVYGRINLRKVFGHIDTDNLDVYAGSHVVVTDPPDNNRIHIALFTTNNDFDTRTEARDRIESYVVAGPESRMVLYGRQLVGQQAILVYQRTTEPLPEVGDVYCLSKETAGVVVHQQFVKVDSFEYEDRVFEDNSGEFTRRVITLLIGAVLRFEFKGPETPSRLSGVVREALVRSTSTADAARYFGIRKLVTAALEDDLDMQLDSVYSPIVPTTQRETAVSLAAPAGATQIVPAGDSIVNTIVSVNSTGQYAYGQPIVPASFQWVLSGGSSLMQDANGDGILECTGGIAGSEGSIDYESGLIVHPNLNWQSDSQNYLTLEHGAAVQGPAHTKSIKITLANRGTVYSEVCNPVPAAGSLILDFRALGKWYRLRDDGTGQLVGNSPADGTGSVTYLTGGVVVTLGALPDVDSSLILGWGSTVHYVKRSGEDATADLKFHHRFVLDQLPVEPGSFVYTYSSQGFRAGTWTVTDAVEDGVLNEPSPNVDITARGTINYDTGEVDIEFVSNIPFAGTATSAAWNTLVSTTPGVGTPVSRALTLPMAAAMDLGEAVKPGTVRLRVAQLTEPYGYYGQSNYVDSLYVTDNGAGLLIFAAGQSAPGTNIKSLVTDQTVGTINYATGEMEFTDDPQVQGQYFQGQPFGNGGGWNNVVVDAPLVVGDDMAVTYQCGDATTTVQAETMTMNFADNPLSIALTRGITDTVAPGSVRLQWATGSRYFDVNGVMFRNYAPSTGVGESVGTIDYVKGLVELNAFDNTQGNPTKVLSCVTYRGDFVVENANFRTAGSPVRPGSVYVQANATDGALITGVSDVDGDISGAFMRGVVNQTMGTVFVEFGELVVAAGNEAEPWYDADRVEGANVWKPLGVLPTTIRYSAVVLTSLPLNAELLGLDPVRLPSDGRVPIYRPGDVVVVHNTKSYSLPNPAVAGATYTVGRTNLSELWLIDQNKARVDPALYLADKVMGTVEMVDPLVLTAYTQPLIARHRLEEMNLVTDVRIDGGISLSAALLRNYDNTDTYVSSALLFSDIWARVTNLFDQLTWTGVWSDSRIGDQATGQYNDIDYPIEVLNEGAVTERWRIRFTSTTAFEVIGENLGVIATGTTAANVSVTNGLTGKPYFLIRAAGWGAGWATGNQLRFNTISAGAPIWLSRTILPGATLEGDSFDMQFRGDVDA